MYATQIRPVTDLRNRYPEVESDLERGPVVLTKNGYGTSVLVSISLFDKLMAKQALYEPKHPHRGRASVRRRGDPSRWLR